MAGKLTGLVALLAATFICLLAAREGASQEPARTSKKSFGAGDVVSVREGDTWSSAKILKREGRKYQIRYGDGTEEWVTSERLRDATGAEKGTSDSSSRGDSGEPEKKDKPRTAPARRAKFQARDRVEILWGSSWYPGIVKKVKGSLYQVHYDNWSNHFDDWVAVTHLRRPGEESDEQPASIRSRRRGARTDDDQDEPPARRGPVPSRDPFRQQEPDDPDRPLSVANSEGAAELQFLSPPGGTFTPDGEVRKKLSPRSIVLKGGAGGKWPHVSRLALCRDVAFAMFSETGQKGVSVVERVDLVAGKSTGTWPLLPEMTLAAVSTDGRRLLVQSDRFFFGTKGRLDIFSLEKSQPDYVVGFLPYKALDSEWKDVRWARFLDDQSILTVGGASSGSRLILWQLDGLKAKWMAPIPYLSEPAVSPGGKQLALSLDRQIVVLDARSGETLAALPSEFAGGSLSFSPDGRRLAQSVGGVVVLFDIAKAETLGAIANNGRQSVPSWADNAHVFVGQTLFSVEKHCPLWLYKAPQPLLPLTVAGGITWFVDGARGARLAGLALPSPEALDAERRLDDGSHLILRPGAKLSLDVQVGVDSPKIAEAFTRQLAALGVGVEPGNPVRLRANISQGQSRDITYEVHKFGRSFERETVKKNITETVYTVAIVGPDNKVAWQTNSSSGAPMHVLMRNGETIDAALSRESKTNSGWFMSVKVPAYVPKSEASSGFGASLLTPQGVAPLPPGQRDANAGIGPP